MVGWVDVFFIFFKFDFSGYLIDLEIMFFELKKSQNDIIIGYVYNIK